MKKANENKKRVVFSRKNTFLIALASLLVGAFLTLAIVLTVLNEQAAEKPVGLAKVEQVYQQLQQRYYKKISATKLQQGAISGMLDALGDPYSISLNDSQTKQVNQTITGTNFGGVGVTVVSKNKQVVIDSIMPETPAAKSNLKAGDLILAVDKTTIKDGDISQASSLIRGKVGTKVTIKVQRDKESFNVTLTRAKITQSSLTTKILDGQLAYIAISQFDTNTGKDLRKNLSAFEKQGVRKVIIDVRGNPGGVMDAALESAAQFVQNKKIIMQYQGKTGKPEIIKSSTKIRGRKRITTIKPIILIDGNSASAAEIFAAALKQSAGAKLVGQTSYGKGTVQEVNGTDPNFEYKYTVAKWLTPDGTWINHKGLKPDIAVAVPSYMKLTGFTSGETLKANTMGLDVSVLQQYLMALGYLNNHLTGVYDTATLTAVKKFQTANNLPVKGEVDATNQNKLYELIALKAQNDDQTLSTAVAEAKK